MVVYPTMKGFDKRQSFDSRKDFGGGTLIAYTRAGRVLG